MADLIFEDPRLVSIYDTFNGKRSDLDHYVALVKELGAHLVLDIGCGTGSFANLLINRLGKGIKVIGLEPARASLEFARSKANSQYIEWILGDATSLNIPPVDLAVMTGNVAQVFLTDQSWLETLSSIRNKLKPNGYFVFEVRDPSQKAWLEWTKEKTYEKIYVSNVGLVEAWCEVLNISEDLVKFRWTYVFDSDGATFVSDSTLRFQKRGEIKFSLKQSGFKIKEVRDAPDRPGKEFVFIAN